MKKKTLDPGTFLYPTPAVMVSCADTGGNQNIIAIAWVGVLCSVPPTVAIGVTRARYSHGLIVDSGEFVINLPRADQVYALDYTGTYSGRDGDKFTALKLSAIDPTRLLHAPLIGECPVNLECRVKHRLELGSHDAFIAEVVHVHADEDWVDNRGRPRERSGELLAYTGGLYRALGEIVGEHGFSRSE